MGEAGSDEKKSSFDIRKQPSPNFEPKFIHDGSKQEILAEDEEPPQRAAWGSQMEFLMSCIATSVGLGNVWRFPFTAYRNGGGAFLIPYIILLILIGKPMYYLECALGQFSSRNSVKVWAMVPAMKGTGYASLLACCYVLSYYLFIVALCFHFLAMTCQATVPWAVCDPEWTNCVASDPTKQVGEVPVNGTSSAELYFNRRVLQKSDTIDDGLGAPIWYLVVCLLVSWLIVFFIIAQGIKSSGKAAYFLAIFPYIVMFILLITTAILPGAGTGILFFLTPQWDKLLDINVWYAAVTQVFYSLSVASGALIMFSSYNAFRSNVYRDAMIVTTLDTFTSLISGLTVFGILGNLAYELDQPVETVVGDGGSGLAFISYPDAIAKTFLPQLFSILFFLMMAVLGIGSGVAILSTINTVLLDAFPRVKTVYMSAVCCVFAFSLGLVYCTPGGQFIMEMVDYYGGSFLILFCATSEIVGVLWIYGLENVCEDIEYMLGIKTAIFWRICWGVLCPAILGTIFIISLVDFGTYESGGYSYPLAATVCGYLLLFVGIACVPIFMGLTLFKYRTGNVLQTIVKSFSPKPSWGPRSPAEKRGWVSFKAAAQMHRESMNTNFVTHILYSLIGSYRRGVIY